jgi:hypothetical protein
LELYALRFRPRRRHLVNRPRRRTRSRSASIRFRNASGDSTAAPTERTIVAPRAASSSSVIGIT